MISRAGIQIRTRKNTVFGRIFTEYQMFYYNYDQGTLIITKRYKDRQP